MGLRQTYEERCSLFFAQPLPVKQFFIAQSQILAGGFLKNVPSVHFQLPERVVCDVGDLTPLPVPEKQRYQKAGGRIDCFRRETFQEVLNQHLSRLEESQDQAISVAASLTRLTTVLYLVQGMLPVFHNEPPGSFEAEADTPPLSEQKTNMNTLDPWILDNSLRRSVAILSTAARFAPYIVADQGYQLQCKGVLSSLIQQGQGATIRQTREIIERLKVKAAAHELDRGLSLSLPYFDDREMELRLYDFEVIPVGRIPFDSRCVIMAARVERSKVANAAHFSHSTRKHLLFEFSMLEEAFSEAGTPTTSSFN